MGESGVGARKWKSGPGSLPKEARLNRTWVVREGLLTQGGGQSQD